MISRSKTCVICRRFLESNRLLLSPFSYEATDSTYLYTRGQHVPFYKTAIDIDSIIKNSEKYKRSIEARKSKPIDFELLSKLFNDYTHFDEKESIAILQLQDLESGKIISEISQDNEDLRRLCKTYKDKVVELDRQIHEIVTQVPNLLNHDVTPDSGVKVLETFEGNENGGDRQLPVKGVRKVKEHDRVAEGLGILKQPLNGNVTSNKGFFLTGAGCYLERALIRFTEDFLASRRSFTPMTVPLLLTPKVIEGCGQQIHGDRDQVFRLSDDFKYMGEPLFLAGTSEHSLVAYTMKAIIPKNLLPLRLTATSPCFRAELTQGRKSRGIFRVPQFNKVEMVGLTLDARSNEKLFDEFVTIQKELFSSIGIPFRVVEIPADDLGASAFRKVDMEAFLPGRGEWGEISSCSNCTDYQSQRLHIKTSEGRFVHTVNGTACATPRMLAAILENYQTTDGSVQVPDALQPYMPPFCKERITSSEEAESGTLKGIQHSKRRLMTVSGDGMTSLSTHLSDSGTVTTHSQGSIDSSIVFLSSGCPQTEDMGLSNYNYAMSTQSELNSLGSQGSVRASSSTTIQEQQENNERSWLVSNENINGRTSPEIWPESVPNLTRFYARNRGSIRVPAAVATGGLGGKVNFEKGDITILSEFSSLSTDAILSKLDELENIAYELGVQELHEINRGKFLNIFENVGR